jgi:N6-L-threonylcarbamoyladenine synthase
MKGNALDFSFSGLKTAVLRWVENHDLAGEIAVRRELAKKAAVSVDEWKAATPQRTLDLIASFQARVIDELMMRSVAAADEIGANSVIVSGGVACNAGLREAAQQRAGYKFLFPSAALSADNAAMIAAAAFPKFAAGKYDGFDLKAQSQLALSA